MKRGRGEASIPLLVVRYKGDLGSEGVTFSIEREVDFSFKLERKWTEDNSLDQYIGLRSSIFYSCTPPVLSSKQTLNGEK